MSGKLQAIKKTRTIDFDRPLSRGNQEMKGGLETDM
jgi:hypothetical protein